MYWLFRFVEHGEYKENLYGTSLEAIRSVMAKKKVCLVDVVPEVSSAVYFKETKYDLVLADRIGLLGKQCSGYSSYMSSWYSLDVSLVVVTVGLLPCCRTDVHHCASLLRSQTEYLQQSCFFYSSSDFKNTGHSTHTTHTQGSHL